jgi:hypothetical protein
MTPSVDFLIGDEGTNMAFHSLSSRCSAIPIRTHPR